MTSEALALRVVRLDIGARLPLRGSASAAGWDLSALSEVRVPARGRSRVRTGLVLELPQGFFGLLRDRSGLAARHGLTVLAGVIDADYRGEVIVVLQSHGTEDHLVLPGDRVAQLLVLAAPALQVLEVDALKETERGEGGFGSTGR
jgi:deoxyuridine 5'-triphosphate nucleotidohydrolase